MKRKQIFIVLSVVVVLAIAVAGYFLFAAPGARSEAATAPSFSVLPSDMTLGSPKAPVTLIEYGAPSCPVCAAFNSDSFALLKQQYIDTGKVFYVFRVFPLRPDDGVAEKLARCLPKDKYFAFIDLLFRNQPKWDVEFGVIDVHGGLVQLARIAGMSGEQADAVHEKYGRGRADQQGRRRCGDKISRRRHADFRGRRYAGGRGQYLARGAKGVGQRTCRQAEGGTLRRSLDA